MPVDIDSLIRRSPMVPFAPGSGLPWNEPEFSRRMLDEHLSQEHDRASRRFGIVDQQVTWIHEAVMGAEPGRILDLGCGPGLYTIRLAELGHQCVGLDFSPSSITYAKDQAAQAKAHCHYQLADLRTADLGSGFDAVLMLFGEFNTLAPSDAESILGRIQSALTPSGRVVLELQFEDYVRALGEQDSTWSTRPTGLFGNLPHLILRESEWHVEEAVTIERYWVFGEENHPAVYSLSTKAYNDEEFEQMLEHAGLRSTGRYESLTGEAESTAELFGLIGENSS